MADFCNTSSMRCDKGLVMEGLESKYKTHLKIAKRQNQMAEYDVFNNFCFVTKTLGITLYQRRLLKN